MRRLVDDLLMLSRIEQHEHARPDAAIEIDRVLKGVLDLAVLVVLPVVFLGLVPRGALAAAWWASEVLPFAHAVRWFGAALYDPSPWHTVGIETLWLAGLGAVFGLLARAAARRLAT